MHKMAANNRYYISRLREELDQRTRKNPRYSLRAFAKAIDIDAGTLSRIISGKVVPATKRAARLTAALALSPSEEAYFMTSLGDAHRNRHFIKMKLFYKRRHSLSSAPRELSSEIFKVISDWFHFAILELTLTDSFRPQPRWIASQLGISETQVELAINRLLELGLLINKSGKLQKASSWITTANKQMTTAAHRRRQKQILEKAIESLENDPLEKRSHTGITMAIDPKQLPKAKAMIQKFNRKLCDCLASGRQNKVYEMSIALFPLQRGE